MNPIVLGALLLACAATLFLLVRALIRWFLEVARLVSLFEDRDKKAE